MNILFTPFHIKNLHLKNRIMMSPMCQYSAFAHDGMPGDWHVLHYGSRAVGGAGLIMIEMTDVEPDGRITDGDLGLWSDSHVAAFSRVVETCHTYGAKVGIQIAHAGRKAEDAPLPIAPSAVPFDDTLRAPRSLTLDEVKQMVEKFRLATKRAVASGVDVVEIHAAHGYLLHQFLSPRTNRRADEYGQDLLRFGKEVVQAAKSEIPSGMPLFMRVSAVEYAADGYGIDYTIEFCRAFHQVGIDAFDISSGGEGPYEPAQSPGYQAPYAKSLREALSVPTIAVGQLADPVLAEKVLQDGSADLVAIGRGMLDDPYWALHAARALGVDMAWPEQYVNVRGIKR